MLRGKIASLFTPCILRNCLFGNRKSLTNLSTNRSLDVSGIFPPIVTPFNDKGQISYQNLQFNLEKWNKIDFKGYVVQGSNGEYVFLSAKERVEIVRKVRELTPSHKLIIAGSGCESTQMTIELTKDMALAGAQAVLVITPCYYKNGMNSSALAQHFLQVADSSPVPVILYSVPANTGIDLDVQLAVQLSKHQNIIGMKDSGGDVAKFGLLNLAALDFKLLAGSASFLYPAQILGAVGGVCALANVLGEQCVQLYKLVEAGQHAKAKELQQQLIAPNFAVTRRYGVPALKKVMDWLGYYGGPCRQPLQPLTSQQTAELKQIFKPYL